MDAQPKYLALVDRLRLDIEAMPTGSSVPSERSLAAEQGVSRMTARRALDELEREGLLRREVGRGSFVTRPAVSLPLRLTSFTEDVRARGLVPSSRVLRLETAAAGTDLASLLGIPASAPVTRLHRLRLADGRPMAIERTALPASAVPGIDEHDLASGSLYEILESAYGVRFDAGEQTIRAGIIADADAACLEVDAGSAALELVRTSACHGEVVERTVSTYPGDRFELSAQIEPATARGPERRSALRERD